jgi:hypothetical protein
MHLNYDDLIAHATEHSGPDLKSVQYTSDQREALLKDVMAMANASVKGERVIVIGVKHRADGSRAYFADLERPVCRCSGDQSRQRVVRDKRSGVELTACAICSACAEWKLTLAPTDQWTPFASIQ